MILQVIRRLLGKSDDDSDDEANNQTASSWVLGFKQPASEFVKFRETLDNGFVALENVVLKNETSHITGTIKVKNISFEKRVFIRYTADGWKSFMDRTATYQLSSSKIYDTFSFDIELPTNGNDEEAKIEFCICFEAGPSSDGQKPQQFWDSNDGRNYMLSSRQVSPASESRHVPVLFGRHDLSDAYTSDYENWTKFAAWKNLSSDGPYW